MNRLSILSMIVATSALAGCASTGASYDNARAVPYAGGYYVPAQDGGGDYYLADPDGPTVSVSGAWQVGFGFGYGGGWYAPGGPWWALGPGWGWGYGPGWGYGRGPWWWHHGWGYPYVPWRGHPPLMPPGKGVASSNGPHPPFGSRPTSPIQMQFRPAASHVRPTGAMRPPPMRAPRHGFGNQLR